MKIRISILAGAVALAAGFSAPAGAAVIGESEEMSAEDAVETEEVPSPVEWHCGSTGSPDDPVAALAASRVRAAALSTDADESCSSVYRCRRLDVARYQRSIFGIAVVFKFWHWKRWCWDYPRVWVTGMGTYVTNVDANMQYRGTISSWEHYDTWCCFSRTSGHLSFRQAKFDNCIFRFGCLGSYYPWVRIHAHGDGSYHYSTGS